MKLSRSGLGTEGALANGFPAASVKAPLKFPVQCFGKESKKKPLGTFPKIHSVHLMESTMTQSQLDEVEKLLTSIICMFNKYSQDEALLAFVEEPLPEQAVNVAYDSDQHFSPVSEADVWSSNGFCLANTETILYDAFLLKEGEKSKCADMDTDTM